MSAREKILAAITQNKPAAVPLPGIELAAVTHYDDPVEKFAEMLSGIGGKVCTDQTMDEFLLSLRSATEQNIFIVNLLDASANESRALENATAEDLKALDFAFIRGVTGVAENGAIWVPESNMGNRLVPFICQHLVIVLDKSAIVSTMNHAYEIIDSFKQGFGVFIAGPSKTADIEQSLVIGAHGARSLTVFYR